MNANRRGMSVDAWGNLSSRALPENHLNGPSVGALFGVAGEPEETHPFATPEARRMLAKWHRDHMRKKRIKQLGIGAAVVAVAAKLLHFI